MDTSGVFRAARRRRAGQAAAFTLVTALALGGGGWAVAAQPWNTADRTVLPGTPTTSAEPSTEAEPELSEEAQEYLDAGYWRSVYATKSWQDSEPPQTIRGEVWSIRDSFGFVIRNIEKTEEEAEGGGGPFVPEVFGLRFGFGGPLRWEDFYALPTEPAALEACLFTGYELEKAALEEHAEPGEAVGEPPESMASVQRGESGEFGDIIYVDLPEECRGGEAAVADEYRGNPSAVSFVRGQVMSMLDSMATAELRDAAWEVLTGLPGTKIEGEREDSMGRTGTVVSFEVDETVIADRSLPTETYLYDTTSHALLEIAGTSDDLGDGIVWNWIRTVLPESGSYDEMSPDIQALYDAHLTEKVNAWNDDREGHVEYQKRLDNIEAWGLEDKEMTEDELEAAIKADMAGKDGGVGPGELRGASLEDLLQDDDIVSNFELEIHREAKEGVPPGMIWKAESPNGVPSAFLAFPEGGTIHLWVTPEP
ncbi:hypothetical protein [Myceligenerans halotolerans]